VRSTRRPARPLVAAAAALAVGLCVGPAHAQDLPDVSKLVGFVRWGGILLSFVVVAGAVVALRVVSGSAERLGQRFSNRRLQIQKLESILRFLVYVVTALACVGLTFRLDATALTVLGGTLAVALGFALRDLVAGVVAGITIIFERPFQVGDRISLAGQYGDVVRIGLRSVTLRTLDHNTVTIPNNRVFNDVPASGNDGALEMQVVMEFHVGIDQDVRLAVALVREACLTSPYVFLGRDVPVYAKQLFSNGQVSMLIKARPYVLDVSYEEAFYTEVHLRVLDAFRSHGIHPPSLRIRLTDRRARQDRGGSSAA
jgi:small-conductance mechanosensitive channel